LAGASATWLDRPRSLGLARPHFKKKKKLNKKLFVKERVTDKQRYILYFQQNS
jgi:hypothetical protein